LFYEGAILVEQHRYRDAIARWEKVVELGPATEYARRARRDMRTAADLQRILSPRARH